jgi:hypothetical protein
VGIRPLAASPDLTASCMPPCSNLHNMFLVSEKDLRVPGFGEAQFKKPAQQK